jgi:myo-inositol 2-dehydrogenase / D-chiro-inositol 1-dehydrogenase
MKKLAMIGCGGIGGYHLEHLVQFTDIVELAGFCDLIPEKAEKFCEIAGSGKAFTDYKAMYDEVKPDMVFICIPPYCHGEIEYETIGRGIHFFIEKPMSLDIEFSKDIAKRVKEAGLITAVGFQCRYGTIVEPSMAFMRENEVVLVEASRIGGIPDISWWPKKETSGGMLVESTIHQCDIIRYLFDEPEIVFSMATNGFVQRDGYDMDDLTATVIKFRGGALGVLSSGCYATEGASFDSRITFSAKDKRGVHKIINSFEVFEKQRVIEEGEESYVIKGDGALSKTSGVTSYKQEGDAGIPCDRTFVEAVISGDSSKIRSPYEDALKSLIFALSCNQSMETGLPVKIEY